MGLKYCPFKMTIKKGSKGSLPDSKECSRGLCAIWTGKDNNGECAILLLALNSSTIIKHISPVKKS